MYDLIFNYLNSYIYNNDYLEDTSFDMFGNSLTLQHWLSHSTCIVLSVIFFIVIILFIRYLFRLFGGLLLNR